MMQYQRFKIVILGANSSIGRSILSNLHHADYQIYAFSTLSNSSLSILTYDHLSSATVENSIVLDLRGWTDIDACETNKSLSFIRNFKNQFDFFTMYDKLIYKYVYFSSASAVSGPNGIPLSQYAADKLRLEEALKKQKKAIGFRVHSTYGPFQSKMFVYDCAYALIKKGCFVSKGSLAAKRDLIHQDVFSSKFFLNQLSKLSGIYEVRSGVTLSMKEISSVINNIVGGTVVEGSYTNNLNPDIFKNSENNEVLLFQDFAFPYMLRETLSSFRDSINNMGNRPLEPGM